jgi:glycosyltransferase involved in cell wall biosynthesis
MLSPTRNLLTILIPTFNRATELQKLIEVLVPVLSETPEVDLIVSSNGSTDGTQELLQQIKGLERVRVVEQPINYGMHIHLAWLYGQAQGRYLWMIGDDDMVEPELVERICQKLQEDPNLGWVHLPHAFCPQNEEPLCSLRPERDERYPEGRALFAPYIRWLTFITANVIRSDLLQPQLRKLAFDNYFWPASLLMMAVAHSPACVINDCRIKAGPDITWQDKIHEVIDFHLPKAILNSSVLSRREIRLCLTRRYVDSPSHLDRLTFLQPLLLLRIFRAAPNLCNASFIWRVSKKVLKKLFNTPSPRTPAM